MLIQSQAGSLPSQRQTAGTPNNPGGSFGEALFTELNPQYYTLLKQNRVFGLSSAGLAAPTGFTGGAAGTPIIGLYNPVSSGVDLVILWAAYGIRTTGTTAGAVDFAFYSVNQGGAAVTGSQSAARNLYSQATTGSAAWCMVNVTNTAALASTLVRPSLSLGNVTTTAGLNAGIFVDDVKGSLIVSQGAYLALGIASTLAVASIDTAIAWAELPA